jgi:hypothetical protein
MAWRYCDTQGCAGDDCLLGTHGQLGDYLRGVFGGGAIVANSTPKPKQLTPKEKLFCSEYAVSLNGTRAAIAAGYSEDSARQIASSNLSKAYIKAHIEQLLAERAIGPEEILARLQSHATGDIGQILNDYGSLNWKELKERGLTHLIKKITFKKGEIASIELYDAQAALVHLGRAQALFTDKQEHSGIVTWQQVILEAKGEGDDSNKPYA